MHRIDVRELNAALQSLARLPILSAFRYQRTRGRACSADPGREALRRRRRAGRGRRSRRRDDARDVRGTGADGDRAAGAEPGAAVPEGRAAGRRDDCVGGGGRRDRRSRCSAPTAHACRCCARASVRTAPTRVSFVYLHAGTPFARKGDMQMTLPKMDMPVGIVEWEVFVPGALLGARDRRQRHRSGGLSGRDRGNRFGIVRDGRGDWKCNRLLQARPGHGRRRCRRSLRGLFGQHHRDGIRRSARSDPRTRHRRDWRCGTWRHGHIQRRELSSRGSDRR